MTCWHSIPVPSSILLLDLSWFFECFYWCSREVMQCYLSTYLMVGLNPARFVWTLAPITTNLNHDKFKMISIIAVQHELRCHDLVPFSVQLIRFYQLIMYCKSDLWIGVWRGDSQASYRHMFNRDLKLQITIPHSIGNTTGSIQWRNQEKCTSDNHNLLYLLSSIQWT